MAQRTDRVAGFGDSVWAEVDWNDANGSMTRFRIINNTPLPCRMYAILNPPINGYSRVDCIGPANQTTEQNLPSNTAKFTKVIDPDTGEVSWSPIGISIFCQYPAEP